MTVTREQLSAVLQASMPDGCKVIDYLEDAVPNEASLVELGINTALYGISDVRTEIHQDFYEMLVGAIVSAAAVPTVLPGSALAHERLANEVYDLLFGYDLHTVGIDELHVAVELRKQYAEAIIRTVGEALTLEAAVPPETFVSVGHSFSGMSFGALQWDHKPGDGEVRGAYEELWPHSKDNLNYMIHPLTTR